MKLKQLPAIVSFLLLSIVADAQTNTFPSSGNVGIGTTSPISGGSNARWLTIDGVTYSGGIVYSVLGTAKGYSYYTGSSLAMQAESGVPIELQPNGVTALTLAANGTASFSSLVTVSGNVGIGTTSPLSGGSDAKWLTINGTSYSGGIVYSVSGNPKGYSYYTGSALALQAESGIPIEFQPNGTTALALAANGTASFSSNVAINGSLTTKKVLVTQSGWPDYVFHPSYELKPLSEVADFIM